MYIYLKKCKVAFSSFKLVLEYIYLSTNLYRQIFKKAKDELLTSTGIFSKLKMI